MRIDQALPNDLLVASSMLEPDKLAALRRTISDMSKSCGQLSFPGDFECWYSWENEIARDARKALADLRRLAVAPPAPVTIRVVLDADENNIADRERNDAYEDAARHAIRLARTEFVLFDPDLHKVADLDWKLTPLHEGSLKLTSIVNGIDKDKVKHQVFKPELCRPREELTRKIVAVMLTRLNRFRYVWPFENRAPTVLRDVGFVLEPGTRVQIQQGVWVDPDRNDFSLDKDFETTIRSADPFKFQLDLGPFPKDSNQDLKIDPMSNQAYRVIWSRRRTRIDFSYLSRSRSSAFLRRVAWRRRSTFTAPAVDPSNPRKKTPPISLLAGAAAPPGGNSLGRSPSRR